MSINELSNKLHTQYLSIANQAELNLPKLLEQKDFIKSREYHTLYGVGGLNLHRGWYCPSIVSDIVIGNCSRGRIVKNPRTSQYTYKYYFDENNRLTIVDMFYKNKYVSSEYIIYKGNVVEGYTLLSDNTMMRYSQEQYSNGICSDYHYLDYNIINKPPYNYHYESNNIKDMNMLCEISDLYIDIGNYDCRYFLFDIDSNGTLVSYDYSSCNSFPSGNPKHTVRIPRQLISAK